MLAGRAILQCAIDRIHPRKSAIRELQPRKLSAFDADPRSGRFRCGGRESNFLAIGRKSDFLAVQWTSFKRASEFRFGACAYF